jgi:hypothetical protein
MGKENDPIEDKMGKSITVINGTWQQRRAGKKAKGKSRRHSARSKKKEMDPRDTRDL